MSSKGQVTVPREVREALGLRQGDRVAFLVRQDGVVEMTSEGASLMSLRGVLKPRRRGVTLEEMEQAIAEGARSR